MEGGMRWVVLVIRLPAVPSRHRVAIWRELRHLGALTLGPGVWAVPATPAFQPGIQRAGELARRADGTVLVLDAQPNDAEQHLKRCEQLLDAFAEQVYRAVHQPLGESSDDA